MDLFCRASRGAFPHPPLRGYFPQRGKRGPVVAPKFPYPSCALIHRSSQWM